MFRVKTLNKISPDAVKTLTNRGYTVSDSAEEPHALLIRSADLHSYVFDPNTSCIVRAGAGTNNVPVKACSEKGIVVFNTPGANANAVKELVIGALILSSRNIIGGIEWARTLSGKGDEVLPLVEKGKGQFVGPEISGKTLGVIGLGAIGGLVANAAIALDMNTLGYDPYISVKGAWGLSRMVEQASDYKAIFAKSDYITLHVPASPETKGMLNKEAFSVMKHGVRIINLARGELVNEADLLEALDSGTVACYVTDFPSDKLIGHKNVIAIPHLGASTPESEENCATMAVAQLIEFLETGAIRNSVNFPAVEVPEGFQTRICVTHKNIPNVLSPVTNAMSSRGINIDNLINRSRGDLAYTILDIDTHVGNETVQQIQALNGVLGVRVIQK